MPHYANKIQQFHFGSQRLQLFVPDLAAVRAMFGAGGAQPFPYWAKLWPAAMALCEFLAANPGLVTGKSVLELAAGLGLPGMLAARLGATSVIISDYAPDAVVLMQSSAALNKLDHVLCNPLDWSVLPDDLTADVLLLSDINYDPDAFDVLYKVLLRFLGQGTTIILTTPQRLMAKPFIERLLPYCVRQEEVQVVMAEEQAYISVLVLTQ